MISKEMPMGKAVLDHPRLLPLFPRFGIRTGFGEMSVLEVCRSSGINPDFFLEIANAYLDEEFVPAEDFSRFTLGAVVEYLKATHSWYTGVALPGMERKILDLLNGSGLSKKEITLVTGFFNDYLKEFTDHITLEEQIVLPYILELEKQSRKERPDPEFTERLKNYSIKEFAKEHDRLETSLENLSMLIIKYLPPFEDQESCIRVIRELEELVRDLEEHADMEDRVLVPRVAELEQQLLQEGGVV
jgi:regulator of cell morphogenesis and NO signaling